MDLELIIMVMEYYGNNIEMKKFVKFGLTVMLMVLGLVILLFTCPKYPFMKIVELGDNFALLQQDDTDIVYELYFNKMIRILYMIVMEIKNVFLVRKVYKLYHLKLLPIILMTVGLLLNQTQSREIILNIG